RELLRRQQLGDRLDRVGVVGVEVVHALAALDAQVAEVLEAGRSAHGRAHYAPHRRSCAVPTRDGGRRSALRRNRSGTPPDGVRGGDQLPPVMVAAQRCGFRQAVLMSRLTWLPQRPRTSTVPC